MSLAIRGQDFAGEAFQDETWGNWFVSMPGQFQTFAYSTNFQAICIHLTALKLKRKLLYSTSLLNLPLS